MNFPVKERRSLISFITAQAYIFSILPVAFSIVAYTNGIFIKTFKAIEEGRINCVSIANLFHRCNTYSPKCYRIPNLFVFDIFKVTEISPFDIRLIHLAAIARRIIENLCVFDFKLIGFHKSILQNLVIDGIRTTPDIRFSSIVAMLHLVPLEEVRVDKQSEVINKEHAVFLACVSRIDGGVKVAVFGKDIAESVIDRVKTRSLVLLVNEGHHPHDAVEVFGQANLIGGIMFERRIFFAVFQIKCTGKFLVCLLVCNAETVTIVNQLLYAGGLVVGQEVDDNRIGRIGQVCIGVVNDIRCVRAKSAKGAESVVTQVQLNAELHNRGRKVRDVEIPFEACNLVFHRLFVSFFDCHKGFIGSGEQVLHKHLAARGELFVKVRHGKFCIVATLEVLPDFLVDVVSFCFLSRLNRDTNNNMLLIHLGEVLVHGRERDFHIGFGFAATDCHGDNSLFVVTNRIDDGARPIFKFCIPAAVGVVELVVDFFAELVRCRAQVLEGIFNVLLALGRSAAQALQSVFDVLLVHSRSGTQVLESFFNFALILGRCFA